MRKETRLVRGTQSKEFYSDGVLGDDVILGSIKAYGVKEDLVRSDLNKRHKGFALVFSEDSIKIKFEHSVFEEFDYILVCYDIVKNAKVLTIEADDYFDVTHLQNGTYMFSLEESE